MKETIGSIKVILKIVIINKYKILIIIFLIKMIRLCNLNIFQLDFSFLL